MDPIQSLWEFWSLVGKRFPIGQKRKSSLGSFDMRFEVVNLERDFSGQSVYIVLTNYHNLTCISPRSPN